MVKDNDQTTPFNAHSHQSNRDYKKKPSVKERELRGRIRDAEWTQMMNDINRAHAL